MTDRQLLIDLANILHASKDVNWVHDESTPSEEFEYMYNMIYNHITYEAGNEA